MFIDIATLEVLVPSLVGVLAIAGAMTWAFIKVKQLMDK